MKTVSRPPVSRPFHFHDLVGGRFRALGDGEVPLPFFISGSVPTREGATKRWIDLANQTTKPREAVLS